MKSTVTVSASLPKTPSVRKHAAWVQGIGTAVPPRSTTQRDTLDFILNRFDISEKARQLYKKTLSNKSIETRHFSLDHLDQVLDQDHDRVNARFEREAVRLATHALTSAAINAEISVQSIDFIVVTTCTGYVCPGLSAHMVASAGLRADVQAVDLVGMGCGAAIPALEQANNFLAAHPDSTAAVVCAEICSAAMFSSDEIDIIISNTIFADGAAALIVTNKNAGGSANSSPKASLRGFSSLIVPEWRETLRFKMKDGRLKNVLGKKVPEQAAEAMQAVSRRLLQPFEMVAADIDQWVLHAGGEKILNALEARFELVPEKLRSSRAVLREFGNMSSPTVLFVLAEELRSKPPTRGNKSLLGSFGAGFSAYGALLEWI